MATRASSTLGSDRGDAFLIETDGDTIADLGAFGKDPSRAGDLVQLTAESGVDRTGVYRKEGDGHADYPRSSSRPNGEILKMPGYDRAIVSGSGLEIEQTK